MEEKEIKFEAKMKRLEDIVEALELGKVELDESLSLFQEGVKLIKECEKQLSDIKEQSLKIIEK